MLKVINSDSCKIGSNIPVNIISESLHDIMFSANSIRTFPFLHCQQLRELTFGAHCCDHSPYLFLSCVEVPHLRKLVFESASFSGTTSCIIRNLPFLESIVVNESAFSPLLFQNYIRTPSLSLLSRALRRREGRLYRLPFRAAHSGQPPRALHSVYHRRMLPRLSLRPLQQAPSLGLVHDREQLLRWRADAPAGLGRPAHGQSGAWKLSIHQATRDPSGVAHCVLRGPVLLP